MSNNITIATANNGIPLFTEGGLNVTRSWSTFDLDSATPEQRDLLEKYVGQIVQVSEHDVDRFAKASAPLELFEGRLRYPQSPEFENAPAIGTRHQKAAAIAAELAAPPASTDDTTPRGLIGKKAPRG